MVVVSGVISSTTSVIYPLQAAGYLDGIGFGLATLLTVVVGGENSNNNQRGRVVSLDQVGIAIGILTFTIVETIYVDYVVFDPEWGIPETIGVLSFVFGLGGLISCYYIIETPVFHLMRHDEGSAIQSIQLLNEESPNLSTTLNSLRQYVHEDQIRPWTTRIRQAIVPLLKLIFLRSIMTLTFAKVVPTTYEHAEYYGLKVSWTYVCFGLARLFGALSTNILLIDRIGRKVTLLGSCLAVGVLLSLTSSFIGCLNVDGMCDSFEKPDLMFLMATSFICLEFFCGIGQGVVTVYISEAFAPFSKCWLVFVIMFAENSCVIVVNGAMTLGDPFPDIAFFITFSGLFFAAFVMVFTTMPETIGLGLRATRELLRKTINIGF